MFEYIETAMIRLIYYAFCYSHAIEYDERFLDINLKLRQEVQPINAFIANVLNLAAVFALRSM